MRTLALVLVVALAFTGCAWLFQQSIEALMKAGIEALTAGRYTEAIAKFMEVVQRDPRHWEGWLYLARAYIGQQNWGEAITSGRKAFDLAPSGGDVVVVLAEALFKGALDSLKRGQLQEGIGRLVDYVRLRPGDPYGYLELGRAYLGSGAYADALRVLLDGLALAGGSEARRELVASLLDGGARALAAGDARTAIGFYSRYVGLEPGAVSAWLALGRAYGATGDYAQAIGAVRRALELSPGDPEIMRFLGTLGGARGR